MQAPVSVIYLVHESPHGSSVLPSTVAEAVGRATLRRWYTRTCSLQQAQPNDHPLAGGLLHHLLTLTPFEAVVFFCPNLLSPIASIFRSGAPCAARTFLSCQRHQRQTVAVLSAAKLRKVERITKKRNQTKIKWRKIMLTQGAGIRRIILFLLLL